jgi:hypothetical protein
LNSREDTGKDIEQLAKRLNYTSIQAMLESDEFRHIIEPCVTALAKGAGNNNPKEVYCYKVGGNENFKIEIHFFGMVFVVKTFQSENVCLVLFIS